MRTRETRIGLYVHGAIMTRGIGAYVTRLPGHMSSSFGLKITHRPNGFALSPLYFGLFGYFGQQRNTTETYNLISVYHIYQPKFVSVNSVSVNSVSVPVNSVSVFGFGFLYPSLPHLTN